MPERLRAYYNGNVVTVLDKTIKKTGKTKIRNQFGFPEQVPSKELRAIPEGEPGARLRFGGDDR